MSREVGDSFAPEHWFKEDGGTITAAHTLDRVLYRRSSNCPGRAEGVCALIQRQALKTIERGLRALVQGTELFIAALAGVVGVVKLGYAPSSPDFRSSIMTARPCMVLKRLSLRAPVRASASSATAHSFEECSDRYFLAYLKDSASRNESGNDHGQRRV